MRRLRHLLIATLIGLVLCGWGYAAEPNTGAPMQATKGALRGMKTYYMGRFAIDLPESFELKIQSHRFRLVKLEEFPDIEDPEQGWKSHLSNIANLEKPEGVQKIIIKEQPIDGVGQWAKGVLYYGDSMADDECKWDFFVSYEDSAVLFSLDGLLEKEELMHAWLKEVASAYSPYPFQKPPVNHPYYTQHGVIELPYKRQESTYARFAGPMGMKLKVEMEEIHQEPEQGGIISRTVAAIAAGFASGIDIEKIRSHKRTVAGLSGEEEILQGDEGRGKNVNFVWEYQGAVESGERPEIQIIMDTMADNLDEKIEIWDRALDSFRPAYKR